MINKFHQAASALAAVEQIIETAGLKVERRLIAEADEGQINLFISTRGLSTNAITECEDQEAAQAIERVGLEIVKIKRGGSADKGWIEYAMRQKQTASQDASDSVINRLEALRIFYSGRPAGAEVYVEALDEAIAAVRALGGGA